MAQVFDELIHGDRVPRQPLCVLKFGGSVLEDERDFPRVVQEIYRHVRDGRKVVAVVSALKGETDALLAQAEAVGGDGAAAPLVARLLRVGELRSAALLALALGRFGIRARSLDPHEIGLVAEGDALDSDLVGLDSGLVHAALGAQDVIVMPGFIAAHAVHGTVTLGRGGTDLSAIFLADRLGADRVRLIKDVDGIHEVDPSIVPAARRHDRLTYLDAAMVSDRVIQPKAIHAAAARHIRIEVAALGSDGGTVICDGASSLGEAASLRPIPVSLLGCGSVGAGMKAMLQGAGSAFALAPILVRHPRDTEQGCFTQSLDAAFDPEPEILVELVGGVDLAAEAMHRALTLGAEVVTGNKAALARHWDSLHAAAARHGGGLRFSAAVGGGAPIIETLRRLRGSVVEVEGVMNGTCNFLLGRLAEGCDFDTALRSAQALGFAEADPSGDIDGHDAADKVSILAREAFGKALPPHLVPTRSLRTLARNAALAARRRGEELKQIGWLRLADDGRVEAGIEIRSLPVDHPLALTRNEENGFLVRDRQGTVHEVFGKGAGRWPTAMAVFADVLDARRALLARDRSGLRQVRLSA